MSQFYDVNGDGQQVIRLRAAANRSKGHIVWIAAPAAAGDVLADVSVSSSASVRRVAVALHDITSGDIGLYCVRGPVHVTNLTSGNFTAYNGIETDGGNIEDSAGAADVSCAEAATDFAVALESGTTVTELDVYILGEPYTSTT